MQPKSITISSLEAFRLAIVSANNSADPDNDAEAAIVRQTLYEMDNPLRVVWGACGFFGFWLFMGRPGNTSSRLRRIGLSVIGGAYMSELSWTLRDRTALCHAVYDLKKLRAPSLEGRRIRDLNVIDKRARWIRFVDVVTLDRTLGFLWQPVVSDANRGQSASLPTSRSDAAGCIALAWPALSHCDNGALRFYWAWRYAQSSPS
jgi:hypothetical protein